MAKRVGRAAPTASSPFEEEGGRVRHPLLAPGAVEWRPYQVEMARSALARPSLIALPTGLGKTQVAALVAAERLRGAGGFVLVVAPTRPLCAQLARAFQAAVAPSVAERVFAVDGRTKAQARREAMENAWVLVSTPQAAAADAERGRLDLSRCCLLVVDEAHRAVGAYAYAEVAQALRRRRPRALVLGLTASPGSDRRRLAATMEALGLTHLEARARDDPDVAGFLHPVEVATVMVDLPPDFAALQALLERELAPRLESLARLGLISQSDPRLATKGAVVEAGERARWRVRRDRGAFFEALRAQAQAMLLVHALELLETQGPRPLADFLGRLGADGAASRAERALASSPALKDAALMARALTHITHPKYEALLAEIRGAQRDRPGAKALVFAQYRDTVAWLAARLSEPAPVGLGRPVGAYTGGTPGLGDGALDDLRAGRTAVVVATSVAEEGIDVPEVDLVAFFEAVPSAIRAVQRRGRTGRRRPGRCVVLVTRDTRDEGALRASREREAAQERVLRGARRDGAARRTALEEFAAPPGR